MMYLECESVFLSQADEDLGNNNNYKFRPCMINLRQIDFIKQSIGYDGNLENYTDVTFYSGNTLSINKPYQETLALLKRNQFLVASN